MKPYTAVCIPVGSQSPVEDAFTAFVMAKDVSGAMAAGQVMASESNGSEPLDWHVVFMCEGHVRNINDDPDTVPHRRRPRSPRR
jgi:hypothetical protein